MFILWLVEVLSLNNCDWKLSFLNRFSFSLWLLCFLLFVFGATIVRKELITVLVYWIRSPWVNDWVLKVEPMALATHHVPVICENSFLVFHFPVNYIKSSVLWKLYTVFYYSAVRSKAVPKFGFHKSCIHEN